MNIQYVSQKQFGFWFFDFYLIDYDIFIECDGDYWHANPKIYFDQNKLNTTQKHNVGNDKRKNIFLEKENKILLRFWEYDIYNNKQMIFDKLKTFL